MYVIIGLGNPGKKYIYTRHNIGYFQIDYIVEKLKIPFCAGKGDYYFGHYEINNKNCLLVKPTTYMNNSGLVFDQLESEFDFTIDPEKILLVYDDFHLPFGTIRFRKKGSAAGHKGVKSIIYYLGTDTFSRLKIGIGGRFEDPIDHVLGVFTKEEFNEIPKVLSFAFQGIETWLSSGINFAMNNHNRNVLNLVR